MTTFKKIVFILLIFVSFSKNSFGQFRYFFKLFETKEKKFIAIMEENSTNKQQQIVKKFEDEKTFDYYKSKLREERRTEIGTIGIFKTRNEFLLLNTSNSLEIELKKRVQESLSKVTGKLEERGHVVGTFSRAGLSKLQQSNVQKLTKERSSLKTVSKVEVYISMPETSKEFQNIFNELNNPQFKKTKEIREALANENNSKIHFLNNSDALENAIFRSPENSPLILIGHNESGEFRFPDGSSKRFEKIDSLTNVAKRTIIYLSCNSNVFTNNPAANYYLTYSDGIALTNRINNALLKNISLNGDNQQTKKILSDIIQGYGKEKNQKSQYKIAAYSIAISGIGYTLYEIKQSNSK